MMRVIVFVTLGFALLEMARSGQATCADVLKDESYTFKPLTANLVTENSTLLGSISLSPVEKQGQRCFRVLFVFDRISGKFGKLRAGLFTAGNSLPTGKDRFTRRRSVSGLAEAKLDICPEKILRSESDSCCGPLEFFAFGSAEDNSGVRVYLAPSENTTQPCRLTNAKPFQYVCTIENLCN
mmetsp:Transcript_22443/g.32314  ORF Transcript_22443/g.32314 Transcript_22443/m.32314 type:complete len:182 (-) Transcript_22443:289-834(-)